MIRFLIKRFVQDYENVSDPEVRAAYGMLSGTLGLINNFVLFALKLTVGLVINSIAVISDAFNNLSDFCTSLIQIFGVKMSCKPPDKIIPKVTGGPNIASLAVAFVIFSVGTRLFGSSFEKMIRPEQPTVNVTVLVLLSVSVFVKIWMFSYNRSIGERIDSEINKAAAQDSISDAAATFVVVLGTFIGTFTTFPIDGILGLVISFLVMYTGFKIARDSASLLLGRSLSDDAVQKIRKIALSSEVITGVHDLIVHDYGPGKTYASMHAEVSPLSDIVEAHDQVDRIEQKIYKELGVKITIHMDPMESAKPEGKEE